MSIFDQIGSLPWSVIVHGTVHKRQHFELDSLYVLSVANEVHAALPSCFDGPVGQYKGRHALLLVAPSRVDVGSPLSRTMPRSRSQVLRSPARARAFCML